MQSKVAGVAGKITFPTNLNYFRFVLVYRVAFILFVVVNFTQLLIRNTNNEKKVHTSNRGVLNPQQRNKILKILKPFFLS